MNLKKHSLLWFFLILASKMYCEETKDLKDTTLSLQDSQERSSLYKEKLKSRALVLSVGVNIIAAYYCHSIKERYKKEKEDKK